MYYTNAKVVLVGETGVGKTALGIVLSGQQFIPTESTHGRHVWTLDSKSGRTDSGRLELRETILWDLAGQPGYRLIHQLSQIIPWLDERELRPGLPWQRALEWAIENIHSAAVFVGKSGIGPWQQQEIEAILNEFVRRGRPVIPVILEDCDEEPKLPLFLKNMTWIDFRPKEADPAQPKRKVLSAPSPYNLLRWGITGDRG